MFDRKMNSPTPERGGAATTDSQTAPSTKSAPVAETVLGEGARFKGTAEIAGSVRIEGRVEGEMRAGDSVVVGRTGSVEASITTRRAVLGGRFQGKIDAEERVEMKAGSRVECDIVAPNMVMENGVYFRGNCRVGKK
ncbi:MAG: polymer-forming cytoskeletal protein [Gemmatimonadota bacterium]|jgi:cytoskeletal protein CcmA (bactofilin family)|nr:cell division protein [Gemmatimonadota bacterium]MDP6460316.1 polymer-forming cytoskeletal protein [Gemmatimonadota bacterium]MDP6529482.1 polymer-forming cytoskeletal protein [Gemmatimonadota bacterium]MDP6802590.1 polymer-forming cytoskeletal protein [Gemmatimonadota bacterium]MDP7030715.1 polymer-forming cytoskeletal protein [Gemmatimonadota bacterium]